MVLLLLYMLLLLLYMVVVIPIYGVVITICGVVITIYGVFKPERSSPVAAQFLYMVLLLLYMVLLLLYMVLLLLYMVLVGGELSFFLFNCQESVQFRFKGTWKNENRSTKNPASVVLICGKPVPIQ